MRPSRSGESALLLLDVIELLAKDRIDHGAVRASLDADVVLSLAVQKAGALEKGFQAAGFRTQLTRGEFDDPIPTFIRRRH